MQDAGQMRGCNLSFWSWPKVSVALKQLQTIQFKCGYGLILICVLLVENNPHIWVHTQTNSNNTGILVIHQSISKSRILFHAEMMLSPYSDSSRISETYRALVITDWYYARDKNTPNKPFADTASLQKAVNRGNCVPFSNSLYLTVAN